MKRKHWILAVLVLAAIAALTAGCSKLDPDDPTRDDPDDPAHGGVRVTNVLLDKQNLTLQVGYSKTLVATGYPDNAANKKVTWTSSDEKVATVDKNGKVVGVKEGKATITVKTDDGGKTASCNVTVE